MFFFSKIMTTLLNIAYFVVCEYLVYHVWWALQCVVLWVTKTNEKSVCPNAECECPSASLNNRTPTVNHKVFVMKQWSL